VKLLLDTQIFIWWAGRSRALKQGLRDLVSDPTHQVFVGAASIWEISTKRRLKKMGFEGSPVGEVVNSGFSHLPISPEDAEFAGEIVWDHKDPIDRLLVAQATRHSMTLITADAAIRAYGTVPILWAG